MILTLLLLGTSFTYGFPRDKIVTNVTKVVSSTPKIKPDQMTRKQIDKSEDVIMYHENRNDGVLKCLCWAELFIITENNNNKEMNLSNEFAIILESPGDIAEETTSEGEVEVYTLLDSETKKNRTLNFTVVNKTKEFTIKQHKTVHCGAGPILIKTYIEWPKRNKQKIEIRLAPTTPSKWQIYTNDYGVNKFTLSPSFQTFDTTNTQNYSKTNLEDVTSSILETDANEETSNTNFKQKEHSDNSNENVGSKLEYSENDETFPDTQKNKVSKESVPKPYALNFNTNNIRLRDLNLGMKRELLTRNIYFKKLSESEKILSIPESNFFDNLEYDTALYFFDLIYPNKTVLWTSGEHKFLINIQVSIEHIVIENVDGTEQEERLSEMVLEENNVYRLKRN